MRYTLLYCAVHITKETNSLHIKTNKSTYGEINMKRKNTEKERRLRVSDQHDDLISFPYSDCLIVTSQFIFSHPDVFAIINIMPAVLDALRAEFYERIGERILSPYDWSQIYYETMKDGCTPGRLFIYMHVLKNYCERRQPSMWWRVNLSWRIGHFIIF